MPFSTQVRYIKIKVKVKSSYNEDAPQTIVNLPSQTLCSTEEVPEALTNLSLAFHILAYSFYNSHHFASPVSDLKKK